MKYAMRPLVYLLLFLVTLALVGCAHRRGGRALANCRTEIEGNQYGIGLELRACGEQSRQIVTTQPTERGRRIVDELHSAVNRLITDTGPGCQEIAQRTLACVAELDQTLTSRESAEATMRSSVRERLRSNPRYESLRAQNCEAVREYDATGSPRVAAEMDSTYRELLSIVGRELERAGVSDASPSWAAHWAAQWHLICMPTRGH